jgi:hypothetical protein
MELFRVVFWVILPCKRLSTDVSEVRTASIIRDYYGIWLQGLRKAAKKFSQDIRPQRKYLNLKSTEYEIDFKYWSGHGIFGVIS